MGKIYVDWWRNILIEAEPDILPCKLFYHLCIVVPDIYSNKAIEKSEKFYNLLIETVLSDWS
jgi:hypothetical protein